MSAELPFETAPEIVPRVCRELRLPHAVEQRATELAEQFGGLEATDPLGRSPTAIAAAAVYMASRRPEHGYVTQTEIAETAGCSPLTIRQCRAAMVERVDEHPALAHPDAGGGSR